MRKAFLSSFISFCLGFTGVVLLGGPAYARPPFEVPPSGGVPECVEESQVFPGDGYPNPDALGVSGHGPPLSYTDNGDGTATDNNTKKMWELKTGVFGGPDINCNTENDCPDPHHVNNMYSWSSSGSAPDGTLFTNFLRRLNNTCNNDPTVDCSENGDDDCNAVGGPCGFAGYTDWCIPHVKLLISIVDYSTIFPAFPPNFPGSTGFGYWSSTTWPDLTDPPTDLSSNARWVFFDGSIGLFGDSGKALFYNARAVRPCD